ncbi:hypothetical protein PTE30175_03520 [Pandoraea terrae]|uniref:Phasin domain-containing protein n=1 Tax=Pandoraea terrae TaxID=1537710 RepID=A0A5E4X1Z8_9BURK|nr:phasin family protein [Pandoraea terrae]VVE30330.1 hypothetical protein PTE30175_03520 [Pandoraea terrae]
MPFDVNALRDVQQANLNLGVSLSNLWLENMNRTRALALKEAHQGAASIQQTFAALAGAKDLASLAPLQIELAQKQMAQSGNFWQNFLTETQSNQQAILDDFRKAMQGWQASFSKALEPVADGTPTGLAYQPLSAATQHMFDLAKATLNLLQPQETKTPPAAKSRGA